MQADQKLLTIALNDEERACNIYKNKIDKWNTQKITNGPKNRNTEKQITNHSQIEGIKQQSNQIKKEIQRRMPKKSPRKIKKTLKIRANGNIRI